MKALIPFCLALLLSTNCASVEARKEIPFIVLKNYFLSKPHDSDKVEFHLVNSREELEAILGYARTMSPKSNPTPIDWNTQSVFILSIPPSETAGELEMQEITLEDQNAYIKYKHTPRPEKGHIAQPVAVVQLEKSYTDRISNWVTSN